MFAICQETINLSWLHLIFVSLTHLLHTFTKHIYKHVSQIMIMSYVKYASWCPHIIGIVMCPLHVFVLRHTFSYHTSLDMWYVLVILIYWGCLCRKACKTEEKSTFWVDTRDYYLPTQKFVYLFFLVAPLTCWHTLTLCHHGRDWYQSNECDIWIVEINVNVIIK